MPPVHAPPKATIAGVAGRGALVPLAVASVTAGLFASSATRDLGCVLWAPAAGAVALLLTRVLRRSPVPPSLVPAMVALPLLYAIVRRFVATPALRFLRGPPFEDALGATLGLAALGLIVGGEGVVRLTSASDEASAKGRTTPGVIVALALTLVAAGAHVAMASDRGPHRWAFMVAALPCVLLALQAVRRRSDVRPPGRGDHAAPLGLAATSMVVWLALDASLLASAPDAPLFDVEAARRAAAFATAAVEAGVEALVVLVLALHALAAARTWGGRASAALLVIVSSGMSLLAPLVRATLLERVDPLATAVDLGVDLPTETRSAAWWVQSSGTWHPSSAVLLLRGAGRTTYLERPDRTGGLRELPIPSLEARAGDEPRRSEEREVVVVVGGASRFDDFVAGLDVLGERRHGLWLAVAPAGWRRLGLARRLAERAETIALGVEPVLLLQGAPLPSNRRGPTDPVIGAMDPEGRTLGVVVHGPSSRCVLLEARVTDGRLRYTRIADCGPFPLDPARASEERRLAVLRETGARRVLLAPGRDATVNDAVDVLGTLSSELTRVMMEGWERSCPPPMRCEPRLSFDTGSPLVWLTLDAAALER